MKKLVKYKITGLTPLLMHNPESSMKQGSKGIGMKEIPTPAVEAERALYRLPNGQLYIAANAFIASIINKGGGASGRRIGKTSAASHVSAGVQLPDVEHLECPLIHPKTGKPIKDYEIDVRRAVVIRQGILRARPKIKEWSCVLIVEIDTDFITEEQLLELLNISGKVAGVGDYRPQCKGFFGRYVAEIIK